MKFEYLDLEAAVTYLKGKLKEADVYPLTSFTTLAEGALRSAIPPVIDWDGVEPLRVNHRVKCWDCKVVITELDPSYPFACVKPNNLPMSVVNVDELRPIKPKPIKIDHSSLAGSGIDCISKSGSIFRPCPNTTRTIGSIRMNHPMALTIEQINLIPKGYAVEYFNGKSGDFHTCTVTGIKEGYEL